jgi:hypothetical protein
VTSLVSSRIASATNSQSQAEQSLLRTHRSWPAGQRRAQLTHTMASVFKLRRWLSAAASVRHTTQAQGCWAFTLKGMG